MEYFLIFCLIGYPLGQYLAIRTTDDGWRLLFALPAFPMVMVLGYTAAAFSDGATLWPVVLIMTTPFAVLYLLLVRLTYRVLGRFEARDAERGHASRVRPGAGVSHAS
jgi:hypothetical protein